MTINEYLSKLKTIGDAIDENNRRQSDTEFVVTLGVDEEVFQRISELVPMAIKILTEEEIAWGKMNCLRIERIRQANISYNIKIIMGAIYHVATSILEEDKFLRYFNSYRDSQPVFKNTRLSNKLRDGELISLDGCKIINDHVFLDGNYFRLPYYNEAMVKYLKYVKDRYKTFVRVDPYVVLNKQPLKTVLEAVIRPIDPKWIKNLTLYSGNKTAGEYELQDPLSYLLPGEKRSFKEQLAFYEYHLRHVRKLEVYAARGNTKNLHMMIEELKGQPEYKKYYVGKCIHLDTDDAVGTAYENAILNHIDLAINVYDKDAFEMREVQSLSQGKVTDATFRTHILRVEKVPFLHLPQIAADFLDSITLYLEWMDNMFGGKKAGYPFICE